MKRTLIITGILFSLNTFSAYSTIVYIPVNYPTIQQGINASSDGDTVLVFPGTYIENIHSNGYNVVLGSFFLTTGDTSYISITIIDGDSATVVSFYGGVDSTTILAGFTITNGSGYYGGIFCSMSSPQIRNNLITGNSAFATGGIHCNTANPIIKDNKIINNISISINGAGGICCNSSSPVIDNNIIINNTAFVGGGIICYNSNAIISNNIIVGNSSLYGGGIHISNSFPILTNNAVSGNFADNYGGGVVISSSIPTVGIRCDEISSPYIQFCNVQDTLWPGVGNISVDPLFRDPANADFHLMSIACGDSADSPCIDAGDPDILDSLLDCSWGLGGARSDMGAYGGGDSLISGIIEGYIPTPNRIMLMQNYPNPFNAQTQIEFILPEPREIKLTIYDLLGRRVHTVLDEYRQAGVHTVTVDASHLSSGVYFYRLQAGEMVETKRMILLK
jgi:hypothetical protein